MMSEYLVDQYLFLAVMYDVDAQHASTRDERECAAKKRDEFFDKALAVDAKIAPKRGIPL